MRRLSRLLSRSSVSGKPPPAEKVVQQRVPLLELPTEILLLIESHLLYEHALCLSLTCKQAYNLLFQQLRPDGKHHGREQYFLRLLERDHPTLLSCQYHEILYDWRRRKAKRYRCPRCVGSGHSLVTCNKSCRVGFQGIFDTERRLMIRSAFLTPLHGLNMRGLNHVCKRSSSSRANEVAAKISNQSLMVWRVHHFTTRFDFHSWANMGIDQTFNEPICVHSDRSLRSLVVACICHARRRRQWLLKASSPERSYTDIYASWYCPTLFKCPQCATDVRVRMDQVSRFEIVVRFDVFQDLGGLEGMTVAQRQVLGTRLSPMHQKLTRSEKRDRLRENLESRYFERSEVAEKYCEGIPWNTAFLGQWWHNFRYTPHDPIYFRPDEIIPRPIWLAYRKIRFRKERDFRVKA